MRARSSTSTGSPSPTPTPSPHQHDEFPRPCIRELLRTCVHPARVVLRVEKILIEAVAPCAAGPRDTDADPDPDPDTDTDTNPNPNPDTDDPKTANKNGLDEKHAQAIRLVLSDGELMVQAVLGRALHAKFAAAEGSLLALKRFRIRRARRLHGEGRVVYLAVSEYDVVVVGGGGGSGGGAEPPAVGQDVVEFAEAGGFLREEGTPLSQKRRRGDYNGNLGQLEEDTAGAVADPEKTRSVPSTQDSDDGSSAFESYRAADEALKRRRQALKALSTARPQRSATTWQDERYSPRKRRKVGSGQPGFGGGGGGGRLAERGKAVVRFEESRPASAGELHPRAEEEEEAEESRLVAGQSTESALVSHRSVDRSAGYNSPSEKTSRQPHSSTTGSDPPPRPPIPFHTLGSLLKPPAHAPLPSRNYHCTVLAVITWVSPTLISKPNSPFPPKRHIKIHDLSIRDRYSGITVAVFVNATNFKPALGTVALFRGVVMQRWEGEVILNAYATLKERIPGEDWYIDDEKALEEMGFDVSGLKSWWAEKRRG